MKFLYLFEDGRFKLGPEPTEDDLEMVDQGVLEILNLEDKTYYLDTEWHAIEEIEPMAEVSL